MSDLLNWLRMLADAYKSVGDEESADYGFQAADLIEQLQQRVDELVDALDHIARVANSSRTQSRRDRWICLRANCAISSSDEWKTANLPKIIENSRGRELRLRAENQELSATVERLRDAGTKLRDDIDLSKIVGAGKRNFANEWDAAVSATPHQNLNAIKREVAATAIRVALRNLGNADLNESEINHFADDCINQLYPSVKDGE